ncbi:MAG: alpha/beta fold hydrolase [Betaproteobacteria bacterium]
MPRLKTDDGVSLHYEEAGAGTPIVFVHEFAGDQRSWEPQVRYFSRRYRCIAYNARGYPPSEVPESFERYSQERARDDVRAVLDALEIERAHVVGLSMGAFATLHFGMAYPKRALSITMAGVGSGAHPAQYESFQRDAKANAEEMRSKGMAAFAARYGRGPARVQFEAKDPRGFAEFLQHLAEHSAQGSANTMQGYQGRRPSLYALTDQIKRIQVPALIIAGDEDDITIEASLVLKRAIPAAGLATFPKTGHAMNLEEPALFNQTLDAFLHQVEAGRWGPRDPRSPVASVYGPGGKPSVSGPGGKP